MLSWWVWSSSCLEAPHGDRCPPPGDTNTALPGAEHRQAGPAAVFLLGIQGRVFLSLLSFPDGCRTHTAGTVCSVEMAACTLEKPFIPSCFISFQKGFNLPPGGPFHFMYSNKTLLKVQQDFTAKTTTGLHGLTP